MLFMFQYRPNHWQFGLRANTKTLYHLFMFLFISWQSAYGPDKVLNDKDLLAIMKLLPTIQHPFIYPVTFATANETGGFTIRTFHATGTLRDSICKVCICMTKDMSFIWIVCKKKSYSTECEIVFMSLKLFCMLVFYR